MQTVVAACVCAMEKRIKIGEQSCRSRTDFLLYLSSFRAERIVVSRVVFVTFCLQKYATFYVRVARMAHVSNKRAPGAISQQASGESATFCLPSRLSRVRAPSPAPLYRPSLCKPSGASWWQPNGEGESKRRFCCAQKGVQRHSASLCARAFLHEKSYPRVGFPPFFLRASEVPTIVARCFRMRFWQRERSCSS